jgi:hypothetical protein
VSLDVSPARTEVGDGIGEEEEEEGEGEGELWGLNSQSSLIGLVEKTEKGDWRITDSGIIQVLKTMQ